MNLKTFLQENNVTEFETIPGVLIMNAVVESTPYGIDVDTSNIESGTQLVSTSNFTIENDILTVDGISLNTNETQMLGHEEL